MRMINRRSLLQLGAAALLAPRGVRAATPYRVGVGADSNPYAATLRAVNASESWTSLDLAGKTVVIKPNIVLGATPETGIVTDPEVVRAIVDLALQDGAGEIQIVEASPVGALFDRAGYGFFESYDPLGRVSLTDLGLLPVSLSAVPDGHNYRFMYRADLLSRPDVVLVNVAKMKTHWETVVSLTAKNLFGLPDLESYFLPITATWGGRWSMHVRGVSHSIVDINKARPTQFAVIDGIWAMEGRGPVLGNPVGMNLVLAGSNPVAVDRVATEAMGVRQPLVRHLAHLAAAGLGPSGLDGITVLGDPLPRRNFQLPVIPPILEPPFLSPRLLRPAQGQELMIVQRHFEPCVRQVDIQRLNDASPKDPSQVRLLVGNAFQPAGIESLFWDGRAEDGSFVPPGRYAVHIKAISLRGADVPVSHVINWVTVLD